MLVNLHPKDEPPRIGKLLRHQLPPETAMLRCPWALRARHAPAALAEADLRGKTRKRHRTAQTPARAAKMGYWVIRGRGG